MIFASFYLLLTYLLASVPFGLLLGVVFADVDPRTGGSGNIGATNVYRLLGARLGIATLIADILKGFLPTLLAAWIHPDPRFAGLVAIAAFMGHCYSAYLNLQGGKGVATATGAFLAINPIVTLVCMGGWFVIVRQTRRASLGALIAVALLLPLMYWRSPDMFWVAVVLAIGILIRHTENIRRLIARQELSA